MSIHANEEKLDLQTESIESGFESGNTAIDDGTSYAPPLVSDEETTEPDEEDGDGAEAESGVEVEEASGEDAEDAVNDDEDAESDEEAIDAVNDDDEADSDEEAPVDAAAESETNDRADNEEAGDDDVSEAAD